MLFKAARSPVFARGKKVETLEQILMVIGVKQTFNLVQAVALATVLSDGARKAYEVFWMRSQEVAQIAATDRQGTHFRLQRVSRTRPTWPASSTNAACRC